MIIITSNLLNLYKKNLEVLKVNCNITVLFFNSLGYFLVIYSSAMHVIMSITVSTFLRLRNGVHYPLEKPPTQVGYNITQYFVSIVLRPGLETPMFNGPPQISPRNKQRSVPVSMSPVAFTSYHGFDMSEQSYILKIFQCLDSAAKSRTIDTELTVVVAFYTICISPNCFQNTLSATLCIVISYTLSFACTMFVITFHASIYFGHCEA